MSRISISKDRIRFVLLKRCLPQEAETDVLARSRRRGHSHPRVESQILREQFEFLLDHACANARRCLACRRLAKVQVVLMSVFAEGTHEPAPIRRLPEGLQEKWDQVRGPHWQLGKLYCPPNQPKSN